jgi:glycosyltransferase involved in cell wall biosynthesis
MKGFYRRVLVAPSALPLINQSRVDLWDHSKPLLSVVIPCHNYGQYIREAVLSLVLQTFKDFEIIIVDDGSDDRLTLETLDDLRREGTRVLRQEKLNLAAARNHGISIARGKYLCCLDADDKLEPTYLEKCICLLESNPGVAFAYSLVRTFGDENQIWLTEPFDLRMLLEYNHICATAIFQKLIWEKVGGFDVAMDGYEDWEFWIKVGEAGFRGRLIPEILFNYRRHGITLRLQSDRRSQKLIDHIRANHYELYSNPDQIREIQNGYRDIATPQPFINLSLMVQYEDSKTTAVVIVASIQGMRTTEKFLRQISLVPNTSRGIRVLFISTDDASYEHDESMHGVSDQMYFLPRFLDSHCWLSFVLNVIETRSAKLVVISESQLAYEWTAAIKAGTSATIVDILQDEIECRLSADHDQFIDFHVTISARAQESVTRDFAIPGRKIYSFPELVSLSDRRNELLHALGHVA